MTALVANVSRTCRNTQNKIVGELVIANASVLYIGGILCTNTSNQLVPAADSAAIRFAGIFEPNYGLFGPSVVGDGVITGRFTNSYEILLPCAATVVASMRGTAMYAADDEGVTNVNTLGPQIGTLVELESATMAWVRLLAGVLLDAI